jgi:hypothetical protein
MFTEQWDNGGKWRKLYGSQLLHILIEGLEWMFCKVLSSLCIQGHTNELFLNDMIS